MKKRNFFQIEIDPELREAAKQKALDEGRTLSEVIRKYLKRYVRKSS